MASSFISPEVLSALSGLELKANYLISGIGHGLHQSLSAGQNMDFKEYRDYIHGDEVRAIDWKLYSRSDRLCVKVRESDQRATRGFLWMQVAPWIIKVRKRIARSGSLLNSWSSCETLSATERFTVLCGSFGRREFYVKSAASNQAIFRMIRNLETLKVTGSKGWDTGMIQLRKQVHQGALVVLISDFYSENDELKETLSCFASKGCEVILLHVLDPIELDFNLEESCLIQDLESSQNIRVNPVALREQYLKRIQKHCEDLDRLAYLFRGDRLQLRTDELPLQAMRAYLSKEGHWFDDVCRSSLPTWCCWCRGAHLASFAKGSRVRKLIFHPFASWKRVWSLKKEAVPITGYFYCSGCLWLC